MCDLDTYARYNLRGSCLWLGLALSQSLSPIPYGFLKCWRADWTKHIAIPLTLQFVAGLCMQLDFSVSLTEHLSTLMCENLIDATEDIQHSARGQESSNARRGSSVE